MLQRSSDDQNDDPWMRYDERLVRDEATWADTTPRAKRSKVFLAFPLMLLSKTVDKAVAISGSFLPTKMVLRPTTRGDESPLLRSESMSADGDSLAAQQSNKMERDFMQEKEPLASTPCIEVKEKPEDHLSMLIEILGNCGRTLEELSEEALRWSKLTNFAVFYFEDIACDVEAEIARLDIWATHEDEAQDLRVGDSSSNKRLKNAIEALEGILSAAENIRKQVELLGSLTSQNSVDQTGCEIESVNILPNQELVEKIAEQMKTSYSLAGQEEFADNAFELLVPPLYCWPPS